MADVCFSSGGCPTSESRKRRAGGFDAGEGCGSTWFKRHRTGNSFARRLLHLRGFAVDVRQAEDLARFIDLLPLEMEQEVSTILEKCTDIDDAIRQLTSLKINLDEARDQAEDKVGAEASPLTVAAETLVQSENAQGTTTPSETAGEGNEEAKGDAEKPVLTQEWVSACVQEMSGSTDIPDAHNRATRVLSAFEGAVRAQASGREAKALARAKELANENVILKRAIVVQNKRSQEHGQLQRQAAELQQMCAQYQEQLQQAQLNNYSLSIHLRQAMNQAPIAPRNPDIF